MSKMEVLAYDGKADFRIWSLKMRALLSHHKVSAALEPDEDKWTEEQLKRKDEIKQEAYDILVLSLTESVLRKVSGCTTALDLWNKLGILYASPDVANLAYLKASMFAYKLDMSRTIDENLDDFLKSVLMLAGTPYALDDTSAVMILMNALPDSYHVVKDAFQYSGTVPSYDLLCTALRTRELELRSKGNKTGTNLFVNKKNNQNKGKNKNKGQNGGNKTEPGNQGNNQGNNNNQNKKSSNNHSQYKCYHCGKMGHIKKNCYKWQNRDKSKNNNETNVATTANSVIESAEVLNVTDSACFDQWILDSGYSYHMCPNKSLFIDFWLITRSVSKLKS